jgi:hypothetical protein
MAVDAPDRRDPFCDSDRDRVTTPRWQAGFDLAIGRALAVKVRTEGYNAMLAEAKQGLRFQNLQSDTWVLLPSESVTASSALSKDSSSAHNYLQRVLDEHQGTRWALLAERELSEPLVCQWYEEFTDIVGRLARAEAARNRPRPERPERLRADPRPVQPAARDAADRRPPGAARRPTISSVPGSWLYWSRISP